MANFKRMTAAFTDGLSAMPSMTWPEGAVQSFLTGAVLVAASNAAAVATADPTLGTVLGIAEGPATGTTAADCRFVPALPHITFEGTLDIPAGTYVLAAAALGLKCELQVTSGIFYLEQDQTTNTRVIVVGFKDPIGTVSPRVYFKFLRGVSLFDVAGA